MRKNDDLISRQAAIDAIDKIFPADPMRNDYTQGITCGAALAEEYIKQLPSAQGEFYPCKPDIFELTYEAANSSEIPNGWIPTSEQLPKEGERVLATHLGGLNPNRQVIEHIYKSGQFTLGWDMDMDMKSPTFGKRQMGKVIAWMPMPEPYQENDNQDKR